VVCFQEIIFEYQLNVRIKFRPDRLAYQPPASSTFIAEQTSPSATSQQYFSFGTNQHQSTISL
jgi:hypothetical protein